MRNLRFNYHKSLIFLFCLFANLSLNAQYYNVGQDPANIKWQQVKTENFKIIYPENFAQQAQHLANTLQYVRIYGTKTLGHQPKQLTVILHNKTIVANAFSLWAPKRNEFFTCPPQNNYAQDWLEQLALHEYRHITQMDMLNKGFTKGLTWLLGQHVNTAVLGLFVPMWFMEGDAVSTETALSKSGRGRVPSFEMKVRAQVLGNKIYNYDKAVLGSYKDYVPDQYNFGYQIEAVARKKYGTEIWKSAMNYTAKYPFLITPFNKGLKKITGLSKTKLYKSIFTELDSLWKIQRDLQTYTNYISITPDKQKIYTNYKFAHYISDSIIIAEKSGMDDIARFVMIDRKGQEKVVYIPGFYTYESLSITKTIEPNSGENKNSPNSYTTDNLSLSKDFMVWAERKFDKRWGLRDYSVIITHNIKSGKTKQITNKSRYFAPYLFPDASKIVAVEVTEDNICSLVILNTQTGEVLKKIQAGYNSQFLTPSVSDDGNNIVVVLFNNKGKSVVIINTETYQQKTVLNPIFNEITNPLLYKNYLFYNDVCSGIDNIYVSDISTGKKWQVTSALYGANDIDISPDGKKIIYSNYTPSGYQLAEADFDFNKWNSFEQIQDNSVQLYKSLLSQETGLVDSVNIPNKYYKPQKYIKWQHLFNPHSWVPAFIDVNNLTFHPGITLMSQNMLGTTISTLGYDYNNNYKTGRYYANVSYRGWYPVFDITYSYGKDAVFVRYNDNNIQKYKWNSSDVKFGIRLPLTFTNGNYIQYFEPTVNTHLVTAEDVPDAIKNFLHKKIHTVNYSIIAFNQIKSVERDMRPRWGQEINIEYTHTPLGGSSLGNIFSGEISLLFPGLFRHHSFMLMGGMQKKSEGDYSFSDILFYPRGYSYAANDKLKSISFNYKLPLFYPDFKIGSLFYFKSFKANLFYDYSEGKTNIVTKQYNSTGLELTSDINVLRFIFPVEAGLRTMYLPDSKGKISLEFLFGMNFTGF